MEYKFKPTPMPRRSLTTDKIMKRLYVGLLIVYIFGVVKAFGWGKEYGINAILMLLVSTCLSFACEAVYSLMVNGKKDVMKYLSIAFPYVTPMILVLTVPCNTSLYVVGVATVLAVVFGKLVFGGFGQNVFNPAAVGRAIISQCFTGVVALDAIASPTITTAFAGLNWVADAKSYLTFIADNGGFWNIIWGNYFGAIGETCTLIILVVAVLYAFFDVIDWRIPATYIGVLFVSSYIIGLVNGLGIDYPVVFCSTGGAMFGAVFMLTDPVTNPQTRPGKIVFAALAALFTVAIRFLSKLPEGVVYSILLVNILSPAIDKLFSSKQVLAIKRNAAITFGTIAAAIIFSILIGCSVTPGKYTGVTEETGASTSETSGASTSETSGASTSETEETAGASESTAVSGTFETADYSSNEAVVSKDGDTYHVSVKGFHALEGGANNEFDIVVVDGAVVSIECTAFNDTQGVGTAATSEDALSEYEGTTLADKVDAMTGCTYTSNSVNAAVQAALKEASK